MIDLNRTSSAVVVVEDGEVNGDDLNRALWVAFVRALGGFLTVARRLLGMKHGATCPVCGWRH